MNNTPTVSPTVFRPCNIPQVRNLQVGQKHLDELSVDRFSLVEAGASLLGDVHFKTANNDSNC